MADGELRLNESAAQDGAARVLPLVRDDRKSGPRRPRLKPLVITLAAVAVAAALSWQMWDAYMRTPWTRDGMVRVYVVTLAPEVAGHIVALPVADNKFVHKGDLLMVVDPTNFRIAVAQAEAAVAQTKAVAQNAEAQAERRRKQTSLSVSDEEKQLFASQALAAQAAFRQAQANLDQARVNLQRTRLYSPVNGYVTNLLAQLGDYVTVGAKSLSLVDADSFWIDAYFEETDLDRIHEKDPAAIKLMGYSRLLRGHVDGVSRGIDVANARPDGSGLASVNPIFTWVRLAQRVPVRIHIDQVPPGVRLVAGTTASVEVQPRER
jgi:multidrug resistance efflux pump